MALSDLTKQMQVQNAGSMNTGGALAMAVPMNPVEQLQDVLMQGFIQLNDSLNNIYGTLNISNMNLETIIGWNKLIHERLADMLKLDASQYDASRRDRMRAEDRARENGQTRGGAAGVSATNPWEDFKDSLNNAKSGIGAFVTGLLLGLKTLLLTAFAPAAILFATDLEDKFTAVFAPVWTVLKGVAATFQSMSAGLGSVGKSLTALATQANKIVGFFAGGFGAAFTKLSSWLQSFSNVANKFANKLAWIQAFISLFDFVQGFTKAFKETGSILSGIAGGAQQMAVEFLAAFSGGFLDLISGGIGMIMGALGFDDAEKFFKELDFTAVVKEGYNKLIEMLKGLGSAIVDAFIEFILPKSDAVKQLDADRKAQDEADAAAGVGAAGAARRQEVSNEYQVLTDQRDKAQEGSAGKAQLEERVKQFERENWKILGLNYLDPAKGGAGIPEQATVQEQAAAPKPAQAIPQTESGMGGDKLLKGLTPEQADDINRMPNKTQGDKNVRKKKADLYRRMNEDKMAALDATSKEQLAAQAERKDSVTSGSAFKISESSKQVEDGKAKSSAIVMAPQDNSNKSTNVTNISKSNNYSPPPRPEPSRAVY